MIRNLSNFSGGSQVYLLDSWVLGLLFYDNLPPLHTLSVGIKQTD